MAYIYLTDNIRLQPAPIVPTANMAKMPKELQDYVRKSQDWSKQVEQSLRLLAKAVNELQTTVTGGALSAIVRFSWDLTGGTQGMETGVSFIDLDPTYNNLPIVNWACWVEGMGNPPYVGPAATPYLKWLLASDFGSLTQSTAINIDQIARDYPATSTVTIRLASNWYTGRLSGNFKLQYQAFSGGTTVVNSTGKDFANEGGKLIQIFSMDRNSATETNECTLIDQQGTLSLTLETGISTYTPP